MLVPDGSYGPMSYFGQLVPASPQLNVTILSPDSGTAVTPSVPWWTLGFGRKAFTAVVRVINNTPAINLTLQSLVKSGAVFLSSPIPDITDDLPYGTAKDYSIEITPDENLHGQIPTNLTVTVTVGSSQTATEANFFLNL
jgi:hypothetical protein